MTLSLIIPVQNDEASLPLVVQEALGILPNHFTDFEVIIVDSGSSDRSMQIGARLAADYDPVAVLIPRRRGYGAAVIHALGAARGEYVLVMDADRRLTISDIARLAPFVDQYDIVLGYRALPERVARTTGAGLLRRLSQWLFAVRARDLVCGFKLFRADLLRSLDLQTTGALLDIEILAKARRHGAQVHEVAINYYPAHEDGDRAIAPDDVWRLWRVMRDYHAPGAQEDRPVWQQRALVGGALAALLGGLYALRRRR